MSPDLDPPDGGDWYLIGETDDPASNIVVDVEDQAGGADLGDSTRENRAVLELDFYPFADCCPMPSPKSFRKV